MDQIALRGGLVADGTGAETRRLDVGVADGRITSVAPTVRADHEIGVDGLIVAPGFIDLHSHADFTVQGWPGADTQLAQGVTTLVTGNCGFSPYPVPADGRLQRATEFLGPELDWSWTDADGFATAVDAASPAVNLIHQLGHCSLRVAIMGQDERPPSGAELAAMHRAIGEAGAAGAYGFSTGLIYAPGTYADNDEVIALLRTAAEVGMIHSTHIRNEGGGLLEAVGEALRGAELTGVGLEISHLKSIGPAHHGKVGDALVMIDEAVARGVDVQSDVYPYTASSTSLMSRLPSWALDGGPQAMQARLGSAEQRTRIAAEVAENVGRSFTFEGTVLSSICPGPYAHHSGRSLAQIAAQEDKSGLGVMLDVLAAHGAGVSMVNHAMAAEDVATVLAHPLVSVASDGWILRPEPAADGSEGTPHPRSFGTFARVLQHYVRETALLSLEQAVHKMTGLPARRLGLDVEPVPRGVIAPGAAADLTCFDPDTVAERATYENPWQLATGTEVVLVNGELVLNDGRVTGRSGGRMLRRGLPG